MMQRIENWSGKIEDTAIEYDVIKTEGANINNPVDQAATAVFIGEYDKADRTDYVIAACSGVLTGLLDSFWVGEFSLEAAQLWGKSNINHFVIKTAQFRGYKKNDLEGAIRFLEKDAPMASDQLTSIWGGGLQHHFRDFAHHASVVGLVFSLLTQFTGLSYGTNTKGLFEVHELPDKSLIGNCFEEKIYNGVVLWFLHLVSDMAGSSNSAGKGTGIPGPILSLAKELSVLPGIQSLSITYKGESISLPSMLSKIFNGTVFKHSSNKDLKRFDLRTELGTYAFGVKQSIPVVMNQCVIRAFYFVRRLYIEINSKKLNGFADLKELDPSHFMPVNNKCILRMTTIATGVFSAVDASDAAIRAFLKGPSSRKEFITGLMLRANVVGIGSFAIALKNDITEKVTDNNLMLESEQYETEEAVLLKDNIDIEVSVEVDSSGIYEYAFYRMIKTVKQLKNDFSLVHEATREMQVDILKLEDDETALFDTVAKRSWHPLIIETEELVMRLFAFYGIDYVPYKKDEKYNLFVPFYRIENGKKIAYAFARKIGAVSNWQEILENCGADGIKAVAMVELGEYGDALIDLTSNEERKHGANIEHITLQDLFSLISDNEYQEYKSYVKKYNEEIRKLIGYRTIVVPSESSMGKMKADIMNELKSINFSSLLRKDGIYDGQVKRINDNFWSRGLSKAVIGNSAFAESFISSEWYYQTHTVSTALEQTAIVAGYLKSVEQLLYSLVCLSIGTGTFIKRKGKGKAVYIEFSKENIDEIDTSLGSIVGYARHYLQLWDVNSYTKEYIVRKLDEYRQDYRNEYFHKDNVTSIAEIKAIRNETLLMYYLLLGAMKITDSQKRLLGIESAPVLVLKKRGLVYTEFEKWLDRILGGDVLLSKEADIYFWATGYGEKQWKLYFTTVNGFSENGFPVEQEYPYIGDELFWNRRGVDKAEEENQLIELIRRYLKEGRYSNNLKVYRSVSAGLLWSHTLIYQR